MDKPSTADNPNARTRLDPMHKGECGRAGFLVVAFVSWPAFLFSFLVVTFSELPYGVGGGAMGRG